MCPPFGRSPARVAISTSIAAPSVTVDNDRCAWMETPPHVVVTRLFRTTAVLRSAGCRRVGEQRRIQTSGQKPKRDDRLVWRVQTVPRQAKTLRTVTTSNARAHRTDHQPFVSRGLRSTAPPLLRLTLEHAFLPAGRQVPRLRPTDPNLRQPARSAAVHNIGRVGRRSVISCAPQVDDGARRQVEHVSGHSTPHRPPGGDDPARRRADLRDAGRRCSTVEMLSRYSRWLTATRKAAAQIAEWQVTF